MTRSLKKKPVEIVEVPKKDISEPVFSFVKTFLENPKRFRLIKTYAFTQLYPFTNFTLVDKLLNESFVATRSHDFKGVSWSFSDYITKDEEEHILTVMKEYFNNRGIKLNKLKELRKERVSLKERQRVKNLYCTGES